MRNVFARGAASGAAAGLLTSVAAYVFVEPVLNAAIALEGPADDSAPVSRQTQTLLGMPAGFLLAGIALGLLFAVAYRVLPASPSSPWRRSLGLAAGGFAALALVPALRYPANPPGVGDPDTIADRTASYLLVVALGVVVVAGAYAALRTLAARGVAPPVRQTLVTAAAVLAIAVGYALLPDSGDAVDAPAGLVYDFRVRSLGLLALLYATLGAAFGALTLRTEGARTGHSEPGLRV
jgi:uncharacterized membrane protein YidH (DUF202 family)